MSEAMTEAGTTCDCGCAALPLATTAKPCKCGCDCCEPATVDEVAELRRARAAIDRRLAELDAR